MNKKIIIIVISSAVILISLLGILSRRDIIPGPPLPGFTGEQDQRPRGRRQMMKGNRIGRHFCSPEFMKERLELKEEQINRIEELNANFASEYRTLNRKIRPQRTELKKILGESNPDLARVRKLLEEIYSVNIELRMIRIRQGIEISKILTQEQNEKLSQERKKTFRKRGRYFWQE